MLVNNGECTWKIYKLPAMHEIQFFYQHSVYKQIALGWQIAKHLLGVKTPFH